MVRVHTRNRPVVGDCGVVTYVFIVPLMGFEE
jgi:hypothetical protein